MALLTPGIKSGLWNEQVLLLIFKILLAKQLSVSALLWQSNQATRKHDMQRFFLGEKLSVALDLRDGLTFSTHKSVYVHRLWSPAVWTTTHRQVVLNIFHLLSHFLPNSTGIPRMGSKDFQSSLRSIQHPLSQPAENYLVIVLCLYISEKEWQGKKF